MFNSTGQKYEDAAFLHNLSNQGPTNQEISVESKTAEVFKKDMHVQKDQQHKTSDTTSFWNTLTKIPPSSQQKPLDFELQGFPKTIVLNTWERFNETHQWHSIILSC